MFDEMYEEKEDETSAPDSLFFNEPIEKGVVPELRTDTKIIATLESYIKSIQYLFQDIKTLGGMNQTMALEAAQFSDDIKNTPIGYYTVDPTHVRLQVSVESLWSSIKDAFKKMMEAIRQWIKKAIAWATGYFKGKDPKEVSDRDFARAQAEVDIQEEKNKRAWGIIIESMRDSIEKVDLIKEFEDDVRQVREIRELTPQEFDELQFAVGPKDETFTFNRIFTHPDPFLDDLVYFGPYIQYILNVAKHLQTMHYELFEKVDALEQAIQTEAKGSHSEAERNLQKSKINHLDKPTTFTDLYVDYSLADVLTKINELRERVQKNTNPEPIGVRDYFVRLIVNERQINPRQIETQIANSLRALIELEKKLHRIELSVDDITFGDVISPGNNEFVSTLRSVVSRVSIEINNFTMISRFVKMEMNLFYYAQKDLLHQVDSAVEHVLMASKTQKIDMPASFTDRAVKLLQNRKKTYENINGYLDPRKFMRK